MLARKPDPTRARSRLALEPLEDRLTPAALSGRVFEDINADGNGASEPGVPGVTVFIDADGNGSLGVGEPATATGGDGSYSFIDLAAGTYTIRQVVPAGSVQTAGPAPVTVTAGDTVTGLDFGNFETFSIFGVVFTDLDGNGTQGAGEPGLDGVTVFLDADGGGSLDAGESTTTTAGGGAYSFPALGPGTYRVRQIVPAGSVQTTANPPPVTSVSGVDVSNVNFGVGDEPATPPPPGPSAPTAPTAPAVPTADRVAIGAGGAGVVLVFDASTKQIVQALAPFLGYIGGLSVATGELTGDRIPDLIVGTATGAAAAKVFDGATGAEVFSQVFPVPFGLNVAAGDLDGDGRDEIILGTANVAGVVLILSASDGTVLRAFQPFAPVFGGVTVAAGDLNGDGRDEIIAGTARNGSAVFVFDGITGAQVAGLQAFPGFGFGVNVAAGDLDGDDRDELIVGAASGVPVVRAFDGATLDPMHTFLALPGFAGGARVAAGDVDGDGRDDLLVGADRGTGPIGFAFRGLNLGLLTGFAGFGDPIGGAFVG